MTSELNLKKNESGSCMLNGWEQEKSSEASSLVQGQMVRLNEDGDSGAAEARDSASCGKQYGDTLKN